MAQLGLGEISPRSKESTQNHGKWQAEFLQVDFWSDSTFSTILLFGHMVFFLLFIMGNHY